MQTASCTICLEDFNITMRKRVVCPNSSCNIETCMKCVKRFFAENVQEPNCMQCRELYTKDFLDENFSKHYRRTVIKNVRASVLVQREQQYLPGLMHRVEAYKKILKIQNKINNLHTDSYNKQRELRNLQNNIKVYLLKKTLQIEELSELNNKVAELMEDIDKLSKRIINLNVKETEYRNIYNTGNAVNIQRKVKCITTGCKGYFDNDLVCRLCNIQVCEHCQEEKRKEHVCNPDVIENIKAIMTETKPCPNCNTNIFKILGCSQMFCTLCHTVFDWETGRIDRGRVHNPHYFEWRRGRNLITPREIGDLPCGGLPSFKDLEKKLFTLDVSHGNIIYVKLILKLLDKIQRTEIPKYPVVDGRNPELDKYSIQYLADVITESYWKGKLIEIEKKKSVNTEQRLLFDTLMAVMIDNMNKIKTATTAQEVQDILNESNEFREYYNKCIQNLKKIYEYQYFKQIPYDWEKLTM